MRLTVSPHLPLLPRWENAHWRDRRQSSPFCTLMPNCLAEWEAFLLWNMETTLQVHRLIKQKRAASSQRGNQPSLGVINKLQKVNRVPWKILCSFLKFYLSFKSAGKPVTHLLVIKQPCTKKEKINQKPYAFKLTKWKPSMHAASLQTNHWVKCKMHTPNQ